MTKHKKASSSKPAEKLVITISTKTTIRPTVDASPENPILVDSDRNTVLPFLNHRAIPPDGKPYTQRLARSGYVPQQKHFAFLTAVIEKRNATMAAGIISSVVIQQAISYIQKHINEAFPFLSLQLQPYGGAVNGISTDGGDIDSTLVVDNCDRAEQVAAEYFWSFLQEQARDRLHDNPMAEADFLDRAFTERFPFLRFDASSYYRGVTPSKDIMTEYSLFCPSRCLSDAACIRDPSQPINVMDLFPDATAPSGEMVHFILKRARWQDIIILGRLAASFNAFEVSSFITRSRIPVLKISLKYSKRLCQVVSAAETNAKIEQGLLPSYYADLPMNRSVQFIVPEGEEKINTHIDSDMMLLNVDICLNNRLAIRNTLLLAEYLRADPVVSPLIRCVKSWASARGLCNTWQGGLSSYGFVLLVIFYLQILQTPILPVLQPGLGWGPVVRGCDTGFLSVEDAWRRRSLMTGFTQQKPAPRKPTISELLCGFFRFYGYQFDSTDSVVSIRLGRALSKQEKGWDENSNAQRSQRHGECFDHAETHESVRAADVLRVFRYPPEVPDAEVSQHIYTKDGQFFYMCIEDPFETHINVGRLLDLKTTELLGKEFRRGYALLRKTEKPLDRLFLSSTIDPPGGSDVPLSDLLRMASKSALQPTHVKIEVAKNKTFEFVDTAPVHSDIHD
ncbi:Poly(A) RNA polymerase protein cid1 [Giardia duodenalis]|uniref:Poly(A) RNA polymerase protein cid1 n=2 Tax=Giardia intestinalis TaxID=5741 RepID=V6TKU9_GIAIN|nr:Poly(A) RNA polymerase protein cid1 [Giardia intestinalis]